MKGCIRLSGALLAATLAVAAVTPAEAYYHHGGPPHISINVWRGGNWHHGYYQGRMGWWWVVGGAWYFYTAPVYPYPSLYAPPVIAVAPVPLAPAVPMAPAAPPVAVAPQEPAQVWYYCRAAKQYYPYVSECPGGWKTVPARPPQ